MTTATLPPEIAALRPTHPPTPRRRSAITVRSRPVPSAGPTRHHGLSCVALHLHPAMAGKGRHRQTPPPDRAPLHAALLRLAYPVAVAVAVALAAALWAWTATAATAGRVWAWCCEHREVIGD